MQNHRSDPKQSIDSVQLMFLMLTNPIGVGILGMVRFVAEKSGHDAGWSVLLAGLYPQAGIVIMWLLLRRFKNVGVYEIHGRLFGKWIGKLFNLVFAAYCLYTFFMVLRVFVELVNTWLFPLAPVSVMTSLFLIPTVYAAVAGLRLLGRLGVMAFFALIMIVMLCYYPLADGMYTHLLPMFSSGFNAIYQGSLQTAFTMIGSELLLVFYPYVSYKKDVLPAASVASWSTTAIYVVITVSILVFFTQEQLSKTIWPMLTMFKHVQMPFLERFETLIIAVWLTQVVSTGGSYLWAGVEGIGKALGWQSKWLYVLIVIGTLYMSSQIEGRTPINKNLTFMSQTGLFVLIGYPLLLLLLSVVMRKKGESST